MNTKQIYSFVRWLLNAASGAMLAYTAAKSPAAASVGQFLAALLTGPDAIAAGVLVVTWAWGHFTHKASPTTAKVGSSKAGVVGLLVFLAAASLLFTGCVTLDPSARAIVVRTEQALTIADATFDTAVHIDDANRELSKANVPAFHAFCEWLREPVIIPPLTTAEPRAHALLKSTLAVKNAYKAQPTATNHEKLIASLAALETATAQAQIWVTSQTTK